MDTVNVFPGNVSAQFLSLAKPHLFGIHTGKKKRKNKQTIKKTII